jgi:hypothetical protein
MSMNLEEIMRFIVAVLGGRNAPRLAIGFILGIPLKMITDGFHWAYPSLQFLAAINNYSALYFSLSTTAMVFSPLLVGRQLVADRTLSDVRSINRLLANAQFDENQRREFWTKYMNKVIETLDPRLDEDVVKNLMRATAEE